MVEIDPLIIGRRTGGIPKKILVDYVKQGKKNRQKGAQFELKTRKWLEKRGWVVARWNNTVDEFGFIPAKYNRFRNGTTGFPDFIAFKKGGYGYMLRFVECKCNGRLDKKEKEILRWMSEEGHMCFVFYNDEGEINYRKFVEYEGSRKTFRKATWD